LQIQGRTYGFVAQSKKINQFKNLEVKFDQKLHSQLKEIGMSAFSECVIKSIRIPSNVEVIGKRCFCDCKSLCEVTFEFGCKLKAISKSVFKPCPVECVILPKDLT
jgi:hypothetical protein